MEHSVALWVSSLYVARIWQVSCFDQRRARRASIRNPLQHVFCLYLCVVDISKNCLSIERAPSNRRVDQASGSVSIVAVGILTSVAGRFSPVASPSTLVAVFSAQSRIISTFRSMQNNPNTVSSERGAHTGRHINRLQNALPIRQDTGNCY